MNPFWAKTAAKDGNEGHGVLRRGCVCKCVCVWLQHQSPEKTIGAWCTQSEEGCVCFTSTVRAEAAVEGEMPVARAGCDVLSQGLILPVGMKQWNLFSGAGFWWLKEKSSLRGHPLKLSDFSRHGSQCSVKGTNRDCPGLQRRTWPAHSARWPGPGT